MASSFFISGSELALEAGVSLRTIQSWAKAGYFCKDGLNSYDLLGYYRWQVQFLTNQVFSSKNGVAAWDAKWHEGRARKTLAEAKLSELELQKQSQAVLPRNVVSFQLNKFLGSFITSVRSLPSQVYGDLVRADSSERVNRVLHEAITEVLTSIRTELQNLDFPTELKEQCDSFYQSYSSPGLDVNSFSDES
jgi:phage terminase Nu1 subunit (DNA packaging protein)